MLRASSRILKREVRPAVLQRSPRAITAFEVLYSTQDIPAILADLQKMAPVILVTNYMDLAQHMGGNFSGPGWTRLEDVAIENITWRVDVWRAQDVAGKT